MDISGISTSGPVARSSALSPEAARKIAAALEAAAIVNDDSGRYSRAQQTEAYGRVTEAMVRGELAGMSDEEGKVLDDSLVRSETGKRSMELQQQLGHAMRYAANGSSGRGGVEFYDSLSKDDQVLLSQSMNATDMNGAKPFEDMEALRRSWLAQAEMYEYVTGVSAGRPNAEQVQPLLDAWNKRSIDDGWARAVLSLFQQPVDRVDLSGEAKERLGPLKIAAPEPITAQRAQGSVFDLSA